MTTTTPELKLSLEVLVDTKSNKVLLAEAGSDFVDVLFGFLTLPLGTLIRQLNKHCGGQAKALGPLGCLNNLYASVSNLNTSFSNDVAKSVVLYPRNASATECKKLKLKIDESEPSTYSKCTNASCKYTEVIYTQLYSTCSCGKSLPSYVRASSSTMGVFTAAIKSFLITDDLRVWPVLDGANLERLKDSVKDDHKPEQKTLKIGLKEIMHLLKWSFLSKSPLTTLFLWQLNPDNVKLNCDYATVLHKKEIADKTEDSKNMIVNIVVQKSTNKLLFVVAGVDFIELLFRLLTIPLGSALSLLGGKSGLWSIDRLYKSISEMDSDCFCSPKSLLINPQIAHRKISNNSIQFLTFNEKPGAGLQLMDLMGDKGLIKSPSMFMVTDDLVVTSLPYCAAIIPHLFARNIPISDVKESALNIGTKEALDILRATLTSSTSALSDAIWP